MSFTETRLWPERITGLSRNAMIGPRACFEIEILYIKSKCKSLKCECVCVCLSERGV